jgi:radical SAM superfamily enzyme YgiQ (UPF0313 family)
MKVIIAYPPLSKAKGCPTLGQNRQFQYFKEPTYIYPVVPAQAATLLKQAGHDVVWLDGIAGNISYNKFLETLKSHRPDLIAFETKTPVIKQHWNIINEIKPFLRHYPKIVLFGDHVTALPHESFQNSKVDFVATGGDYDFLLLNICDYLVGKSKSLEAGIWYRDEAEVKNTGPFKLDHDLNSSPRIDRDLTRWQDYAYKNGNYKRTPGAYIMSGRDCWWGKCTFCSWPTLYPQFRTRAIENVLDEIGELIEKYAVREVMDDTGCFPAGDWLRGFCAGMVSRGYDKKIYFDCNMRFGALSAEEFKLMKKANFRLLLFGLESANQSTLDRINKNLKVERIIEDCIAATKAGLFPHITIMFGYPWESYEDALRTLSLGRWLLKKGYAYTMQATVVIPYPGSPLFNECKSNGWLRSQDWDDFDMKQPVMNTPMSDEKVMGFARSMYKVTFAPEFMLRKLFSLRDADDFKYSLRAAQKVLGHIVDFNKRINYPAS